MSDSEKKPEETKNMTEGLIEPENPEIIEEDPNLAPENVSEIVHHAQDELSEVQDRYLRLAAEFENFKKRSERDRLTSVKYASEGLLHEMLPVMDHLEQAVSAAKNCAEDKEAKAFKNMLQGIQMVLKQFQDVLSRFGIESFSGLNKPFNPLLHEAMGDKPSSDVEPGIVLEEFQKGYKLHDRLVRPARVIVSKKPD